MKLTVISDTHGMHEKIARIPHGDVLIHAGDSLGRGTLEELEALNDWLGRLPHRHKILIAGNHDWCFQNEPEEARRLVTNAVYLEDSGIEIDGLQFWGSPWTPEFFDWAFNLPRGDALARRWAQIPDSTDVLITHGPPMNILDQVGERFGGQHVGCEALAERVAQLQLRAHLFGHIHESHGREQIDRCLYINASTCNGQFRPDNAPVSVQLGAY
ncbi:metallophosphatase domain-containing protein [Marinobacter mobilis]|uniref:Predicted phosphoesterase n=1 Tax=Marinobacter mobilis TaxID=488533 RepID=A0A1H2XYS1_9GAMM|nr:metallophosphatase domain-containing protein [Marinobacter mobilis]SDW98027.1 Predicted phosphoesterase [Marinobacter mobilis]